MNIKNVVCSIIVTISFVSYAADELNNIQDNNTYTIGTIDRHMLN